jgi:hypothetical protein
MILSAKTRAAVTNMNLSLSLVEFHRNLYSTADRAKFYSVAEDIVDGLAQSIVVAFDHKRRRRENADNLRLASTPAQGTKFTIDLPVNLAEANLDRTAQQAERA